MPDVLQLLRDAVGERHCLTDAQLLASYEIDWTRRWSGRAIAVVRPGSVDEVGAVLRACGGAGAGVVIQGGNTGLVGGSVPRVEGDVVLSTTRLAEIEQVDAMTGEVTVGAGATLASVQAAAHQGGWDVGVDLGARDSATIGGMLATNAGGVHVLRYGPMRRQLLGVEAVTADGSILRRLPGMLKDNTGYDLGGLLAGSEGTLAVITRVRLRLVPPLPRRAVALLAFASAADAVVAAGDVRRAMPSLLAAELFVEDGLALVLRHTGAARPFGEPYAAYLLVEAAAATLDPAAELATAIEGLSPGPRDAVLADDENGRRRLWELRERHTEAVNADGVPHKLDVSVPVARFAELVEGAPQVVRAVDAEARVISYGHVVDGNLHVSVLGPRPEDESVDDAVLRLVLEMGGSISAEHGIGRAKVRWLAADRGEADIAAMRAIKDALDPRGTLNPGVLLPSPS